MASHIQRRKFLAALGGAAAWPLAARAQQPTLPLVGFLGASSFEASAGRSLLWFKKGLGEHRAVRRWR
jgi:putative ABC transport system substrate-binding protein